MDTLHPGLSRKDYYSILDIKPTATDQEIGEALNRMYKGFHPDKAPPGLRDRATKIIKDVIEAGEVLKDPERRSAYNALYAALCRTGGFEPSAIDEFRKDHPRLEYTSRESVREFMEPAQRLEQIVGVPYNPYKAYLNFLNTERNRTIDYAA